MKVVMALDIGTSAVKASIYKIGAEVECVGSQSIGYSLLSDLPNYAEQDTEEIWFAVCKSIKMTLELAANPKIDVIGICSQAQSVIAVDKEGNVLRKSINCQDARASALYEKYMCDGIKVDGINIYKVLSSIYHVGGASASVKDTMWKIKWIQENEPDIYKKTYKFLDMKDYIINRFTGNFVTSRDDAFSSFLLDYQSKEYKWSKKICNMFGIDISRLPKIISSADTAGYVTEIASLDSGIESGTRVIGGIIDVSGIQIGSGAVNFGDTHIYFGSSGWVSTVVHAPDTDVFNRTSGIASAFDNMYNYYAVLESAGISYEWAKNNLVYSDILSDELNYEKDSLRVLDDMSKSANNAKVGCDGLMFAPWVSGTRCPFEAADIGGMFINFHYNTPQSYLIRSVIEGIGYHYRLLYEIEKNKHYLASNTIRLVGGGANSNVISQIIADIIGVTVEVPENPQDAGALGVAILAASSDSNIDFDKLKSNVRIKHVFYPNMENHSIYNKYFEVYKCLYKQNKKVFSKLIKCQNCDESEN